MDNNESKRPSLSLSDEEGDSLVNKKGSPARATAKGEGYKFKVDQDLKEGFNFATPSKFGSGNDAAGNSSSEADEEFEHLNAPEDTNGTEPNSVPATPTKVTPHKRTAHLANTGDRATVGSDGSPPSSPAAKKRKQWEDYLAEDEEKKRKRREKSVPGEKEPKTSSYLITSSGVLAVIVAIVYGIAASKGFTDSQESVLNTSPYTWRNASSNFHQWSLDLRTKFPKQNNETWTLLKAVVSSTMKKTEPIHPAAITVLYPPSMSHNFATCFLKKFGKIVNKALAPMLGHRMESASEVIVIEHSSFTPTTSITEFRSDIEEYLKHRGKVALVLGIDKTESENFLFQFHGFCDNFHAVDKRATFLFPVRVPETIFKKFEWTSAKGGDISYEVLTEAWKKVLSADAAPALAARITDAVIMLNEGDVCTL